MVNAFADLLSRENRILPDCLQAAGVAWLLELAPVTSPAPRIGLPRHRLLLDEHGWCWPVVAPAAALPFADGVLPACLVRHLFQPGVPVCLLSEVVRCLCPGGLLVVVNPNPWHWRSWRGQGRGALWLPGWPALSMMMIGHGLLPVRASAADWRVWVPGLQPLLVFVARKPPAGRVIRSNAFRRIPMARSGAVAGHIRKSA